MVRKRKRAAKTGDCEQPEDKKKRSKYNVKRVVVIGDSIVTLQYAEEHGLTWDLIFDSRIEAQYYVNVVKPLIDAGDVERVTLQTPYELQPAYEYNGHKRRPIIYVADFEITYADGRQVAIDIKGMATPAFQLKQKLFEYVYNGRIELLALKHVKKFGGFITIDEYNKLKRAESRERMQRGEK